MDLVIFGAQGIAFGAYKAIHRCCPARKIRCFLVSELGINAPVLADLPVLEVDSFVEGLSQEDKDNIEILIATPENAMQEIEKNLDRHKLYCHVRLDSLRWAELVEHYYSCDNGYLPLSAFPIGYHKATIKVYMAKSNKDKALSRNYSIPEWITPIQVGAALCSERVADFLDCDGESISEKNVNYSELTGLYWIWKNRICKEAGNSQYEYYGLVHYRRIMTLNDDDLFRLLDNDVDVVLPYPMPYEPNIEEHHKRYIKNKDWWTLIAVLKELHPEYAKAFPKVLNQQYLYNYNIILARKQVLADYCAWLFPVLERIEQLSMPKGSERADRYIGYMGETLLTLYFIHNQNKFNIAHTGCQFMV